MTTVTEVRTRNAIEEMLSLPVVGKSLVVSVDILHDEEFRKRIQAAIDYLASPGVWKEFKEVKDKTQLKLYPSRFRMPCMANRVFDRRG